MRELLPDLDRFADADASPPAVATVVKVWGSAPRPLGSKMAVGASGGMAGSVSGGCVEGAVFEEAQSVLRDGRPKLVSYGVDNETAWSVGLSCGGRIDIWIEQGLPPELLAAVRDGRLVARAVLLRDPGAQRLIFPDGETVGSLGSDDLDARADALAAERWGDFGARREPVSSGDGELFVEVVPPPPKLVIVGAVHAAVTLVTLAEAVGFETVVIDPRTAFATAERFPHAGRLLHSWPDEGLREVGVDANTFVALLSHDLKLDIPALEVALPVARYVGALGSRKTQGKRLDAAREHGIPEPLLDRMHNPIGLNLGGRRAEEIAVSVMAEMIAVSHGKDFRPVPDPSP